MCVNVCWEADQCLHARFSLETKLSQCECECEQAGGAVRPSTGWNHHHSLWSLCHTVVKFVFVVVFKVFSSFILKKITLP